jgi:hypothetical protein
MQNRLVSYAEKVTGEYRCRFRQNRSTFDHIFSLRLYLEKCLEYNAELRILFLDRTALAGVNFLE